MTQIVQLPAITSKVLRTYDVGVRFLDTDRTERKKTAKKANSIIKDLQMEAFSRITPQRVDQTLKMVRADPKLQGVFGVSKVAETLGDRDNISQISYLHLLSRCETTIQTEQKAQFFIQLLQEHITEACGWLAFGRQSYLELLVNKRYAVTLRYARNLVHAFRRRLDRYLPNELQLDNIIPNFTLNNLHQAIQDHTTSVLEQFATCEQLTKRQEQYRKKLLIIGKHIDSISQFIYNALQQYWYYPVNPDTRPRTFWKCLRLISPLLTKFIHQKLQLKTFTAKHSYLSALRSIIVSALGQYYWSTVQNLFTTEMICPEHMVTPPYETVQTKNSYYHRVPLQLIMGAKYVIRRSGNKHVLTKEALEQGYLSLLIKPSTRKIHWSQAIACNVMIHKKILEYITNGALINSIILYAGKAPGYKPRVQVVMEGMYSMFISTKQIRSQQHILAQYSSPTATCTVLGLDVNRISQYMLSFSEPVVLPETMKTMIKRYLALGKIIPKLSSLVSQANSHRKQVPTLTNQKRYCKRLTELRLVQNRRKRLRAELHRSGSRFCSSVLLWSHKDALAIEQLDMTTEHTHNGIAKAITSMPDDQNVYIHSVIVAQTLTDTSLSLVTVDPSHTSQSEHLGCTASPAGKPIRSPQHYDLAPCSMCGELINTHELAASHIALRGSTCTSLPAF